MTALTIAPVQWSSLKDIDDVEPLGDADAECLAEIREVLRKYDRMERFGVALLHSHFPLGDDEVMLETTDEDNRTLTLKPVKESEAGQNNVGTIWMLRDGDVATMTWCRSYCRKLPGGFGHVPGHNKVAGK